MHHACSVCTLSKSEGNWAVTAGLVTARVLMRPACLTLDDCTLLCFLLRILQLSASLASLWGYSLGFALVLQEMMGGKAFNFQVKVKAAGHWHILLPSKLTKGNNNTKMEHRVGLLMPLNSYWNKKNTTVLNHRLWGCPALILWNLAQHIRKWRTIQIPHWFCR